MNTKALKELFPNMTDKEIEEERAKNYEEVEYEEWPPFTIAYVVEQRRYYLLLGRTKMETHGFESAADATMWAEKNMWTLVMRVASTVCRDMIQPYIQWKAAQEAGLQINKPELVTNKNQ